VASEGSIGNIMTLDNKVAIVTGATKGIGNAIALAMAKAGADIVVVSRNQKDCDDIALKIREMGRRSIGIATDVTKNEQIQDLVKRTIEQFGEINILVNNAGGALTKKAEDITAEEWDKVINLDLKSVFFCSQIVGRKMIDQKNGKIINIASILGLVGGKMVLPYCAAKGGVIQLTRSLALEWARHNIQVNALCPGYVLTALNANEFSNEKVYKHIVSKIPLGKLGAVSDITGAAIFLASEASNYMTGQYLTIDGGWTAQ